MTPAPRHTGVSLTAATCLRWTGALGITAIAIVRCVVAFAPQVVFDVDPAIDPTRLPGLGPAGSLLLDAILLAACGCGLLGETLTGRGLDRLIMLLALVPAPVVIWHGVRDFADLWRGSTWLAAAAACAVIAHLGRDRSVRLVVIALLVSVLVPVVMRGAIQSSVSVGPLSLAGPEYTDTIAEFEANRDAFFADHGWPEGSPAALIYERRLRQPDPRGWFPTANLFASMMAFGLVMAVGLTAGAVKDGLGSRWVALLALGVAGAGGAMLMAHSKGAMLAAVAGLALLAAPLAGGRPRALVARHGGAIALSLVGVTLAAVVVRGGLLPESWLGERSLLFRWHYLRGAGRIFADHGLLGVGPDGFQAAYTAARVPRSPEEVTSAHNLLADWLSTLGVSGVAWIGLVAVVLWRAGRRMGTAPDTGTGYVGARTMLWVTAGMAGVGLLSALVIEAAALDSVGKELARGVGVIGFVVAAMGLSHCLERTRGGIVNWTLAAATVTLVIHGQIEMTFFDPGSVTWVMCMLGLAGGAITNGTESGPVRAGWAAAVVLIAASGLSLTWGVRAARAEAMMIEAAGYIHPPAGNQPQQAAQRERAAALLCLARTRYLPNDTGLIEEEVRQMIIAAQLAEGPRRAALAADAAALAETAVTRHGRPDAMALNSEARWLEARLTGSWEKAIDATRRLTQIDPNGIAAWRRLGDVLWEAGRGADAAEAYERALVNDDNFELDPLRQLPRRDRELLRTRIETATR